MVTDNARLADLEQARARKEQDTAARKQVALRALGNGATMQEAARIARCDNRTVKRWVEEAMSAQHVTRGK